MKKDLKTTFFLLKHAPKMKLQIGFVIFFIAFGIFYDIVSHGGTAVGGMYLTIPVTLFLQMLLGTNLSGLIQSSTVRKKTQTYYPMLLIVPYLMIVYTVLTVCHLFWAFDSEQYFRYASNAAIQGRYILFLGILNFIMVAYLSIANKVFYLGLVLFLVSVFPPMMLAQSRYTPRIFAFCEASLLRCVLLGYLFTILGCVVLYLFINLLYKKDVHPMAMKSLTRNYIK